MEPQAPKTRVSVPRTEHVRAALPAALQALLDDDPRMQPWVNRVMSVANDCYTQANASGSASPGTIQLSITMHENERPGADIESLPSQLRGIVSCATSKMWREERMPLFTSREGERHRLSLIFE